jgi:hypothetical protein
VNVPRMNRLVISVIALSTWVTVDTHRAGGVLAVRDSRVQFSEAWFDRTCFGQLTAAMARRRCNELLDKRIELADELVGLDEKQQLKLLTAGKADIHRFFTTYGDLKRQFEFGVIGSKEWQQRVKVVHSQTRPFIDQMRAGLNGESSLYGKTLVTCVEQPSIEKVQQAYRKYSQERYASKIEQTLRQVLRNAVDRTKTGDPNKSVRQEVTERLLESTDPPEFYGNSRNYINTVVEKLISIEDQLRDVLNERELKMIRSLYQMQHPHNRQPAKAPPGGGPAARLRGQR